MEFLHSLHNGKNNDHYVASKYKLNWDNTQNKKSVQASRMQQNQQNHHFLNNLPHPQA